MSLQTNLHLQDSIPYRYGLDELPGDITKREILCYFSFNDKEKSFILEKSPHPPTNIVLGIQLGSYRFIGRPQPLPESTPAMIIKFIASSFNFQREFISLNYSDSERTRRDHIQLLREFLELSHFPPEKHQLLIDHLIQQEIGRAHV